MEKKITQPSNSVKWVENFALNLISSVELRLNAHEDKRWYCYECGHCLGENQPSPDGKVCGKLNTRFSYDLFRNNYGEKLTNEEIDNLPSEITDFIDADEEYTCPSTSYTYTKSEGHLLSRFDKSYLEFWDAFK